MSIEAMKQAIEALNYIEGNYMSLPKVGIEAITSLRQAIAEAEKQDKFCDDNCVWTDHHPDCVRASVSWKEQEQGEPVAWIWKYANGEEEVVFVSPRHIDATHVDAPSTITPLYTTPQQQRQQLPESPM